MLRATTACTFSTSEPPKVARTCGVLNIFTSKCASRHNGVHFFDISTSKSGPTLRCFVHFDLEMCFAPQLRALFRQSQLPKVVRHWCGLYILTSKCASRHNGVHFFISHLASWLRTRRFSEPTCRPSGAPNHWKITVFRDFATFSHICIFFLLTLSLLLFFLLIFLFSLPLPCSAFHLSILSEVSVLNFLRINASILCDFVVCSKHVIHLNGSAFLMKHIFVFHVLQVIIFSMLQNNANKTQLGGKCQNLDIYTVFAHGFKIGIMKMCVPTMWKVRTKCQEQVFVSRCKHAFSLQGQIGCVW